MPFDSQGKFTRVHSWEDDRINDIDIVTDHHDEEDDGFADGLSECLLKDGRAPMKGDLQLGGFHVKNIANGTSPNDAVNKGQLDDAGATLTESLTLVLNKLWRVGDIKASVRAENHDNWFLCDGQELNRNTYTELFELIGTNFGAGDGTYTFNLPDYRGKFLRGLGGDSAADIYTTQAEGLPNISGTFHTDENGTDAISGAFSDTKTRTSGAEGGGNGTKVEFSATKSNAIYGASSHVTPINQAVNYFIKVKEEE